MPLINHNKKREVYCDFWGCYVDLKKCPKNAECMGKAEVCKLEEKKQK